MTDQNATPTLPSNPPDSGTIDITNLVASLKDTWIRWASVTIETAATSNVYFFWLKWPIISNIFDMFIKIIVTPLANALEMQGFFLNTAIRKASQAQDYVDAKAALDALPPTVSDEDYENAEKAEMAAFRNFVMVTN